MPVYRSHLPADHAAAIGTRLREERQRRGWTLRDVSTRTNLSLARLSAIENGRYHVDVLQLSALTTCFGLSLDALLPDDVATPYQISRAQLDYARPWRRLPMNRVGRRTPLPHHNEFHPLAELFVGRQLEPVRCRIMPVNSETMRYCYHHDHEFTFILSGTAEFWIKTADGMRREVLARGDAVCFQSSLPHVFRSLTDEPVESIQVFGEESALLETAFDTFSAHAITCLDGSDDTSDSRLLGDRLRALREARRWSLDQVAALTGLPHRRVDQIEQGVRPPQVDVLVQLARAYGRPVRQLLRQTPPPGPHFVIQRGVDLARVPPRRRRSLSGYSEFSAAVVARPLARGFDSGHMAPYFFGIRTADGEQPGLHEHRGQEFVYVLNGQLEFHVLVDGRIVTEQLGPGDTCYLDSTAPHAFRAGLQGPYSDAAVDFIDVFWSPEGNDQLFERDRLGPATGAATAS